MPIDPVDSAPEADPVTADLVRRARAGDEEAFAGIVRRHERMVLRTAARFLGGLDRAQDAAQETFLRLYRYLGRYDPARAMAPWLYRVVVNVCRDIDRKGRRGREAAQGAAREAHTDAGGGPGSRIEDGLLQGERVRLVQSALLTLPHRERAALVLRDLEGRPAPEVARILGTSEGTVRSQVASARLKVKRFVESRGRGPGGER